MRQPIVIACLALALAGWSAAAPAGDLWELAKSKKEIHRFSTLFTAHDVRNYLSSDDGLAQAIDWCKKTGVTKVFIETFRDGYTAERPALQKAKQRFLDEGLVVSGCVTPTKVGKSSTGWKNTISCYTDLPTQQKVREIFESTAGLFDQIMIDDFWFTDCACPECEQARKAKTVKIGEKSWPVSGDEWEDYRCELMVRLSQEYVLAAAKKANPKAELIIKYPQWYDRFHDRGYEVIRETSDFDLIWVGTETRDYNDKRWGGTVQYEAYFIMRWLGGIGQAKCAGGWYDWLGTTEKTYVEQARQTVLGGAKESMLFCYGGLQKDTGPKNIEALRAHVPELLAVAEQVGRRPIVGIAAYKPANSHPEKEARIFDFVGMLGLPLVPCHEFPTRAPAGFFSIHAMKDPQIAQKLKAFIAAGKPTLITDGLAEALKGQVELTVANVRILDVKGSPKGLLALQQPALDDLRSAMLKTMSIEFKSPNQVGLYWFADGSWVVENFNDSAVKAQLNGKTLDVPGRGWVMEWK